MNMTSCSRTGQPCAVIRSGSAIQRMSMLKMIQDKKGVLLVTAILLFYFGVLSLLQAIAIRQSAVPGASGNAGEPGAGIDAGIEMNGFTVTAYCPGSCCNGIWAGRTATGKSIDYYTRRKIHIAAVDPAVIPMGTLFNYRGRDYLAVDIGGKIRGRRIDLLMMSHPETYRFGVRKNQVIRVLSARQLETSRAGTGLTYRDNALSNSSVQ